MTDTRGASEMAAVRAEDILAVRSRISWGPIFAGAVLALALYFLFALLGGAIGLSVGGQVRSDNIGSGAAIYAIVITALCLFVGGYITSQFSVGENKVEALIYGLIMWAVVFAILLWLMASGVKAGFNAMVGVATVAGNVADTRNWEEQARRQGVPQEQINDWRKKASEAPDRAKDAARDPENQQAAADAAAKASWWAFGGALLSMLASAAGALIGSGPSLRLVHVRRTPTLATTRA